MPEADAPSEPPGTADLLQRFIVQGYVLLPPSSPSAVHASVASQVLACGVQGPGGRVPYGLAALDGDAAGNNLLHAAPELRGAALLESPPVTAALRALLGDAYRMHPHSRGHLRQRGARTTMWHVDAYKGAYAGPPFAPRARVATLAPE